MRPANQPKKSQMRTASLVFRNMSLLTCCVFVSVPSDIHNNMDYSRPRRSCDNGRTLHYFLVSEANVFCTMFFFFFESVNNQELFFVIMMKWFCWLTHCLNWLLLPGNKAVSVRNKVMYICYCYKNSFSFLKWFLFFFLTMSAWQSIPN